MNSVHFWPMGSLQRIGQFAEEQLINAPIDVLWRLWTEPEHWAQWDGGLKNARANSPLVLGAQGIIVPNAGPEAKFTIIGWSPYQSYRFATRLPLAKLVIDRAVVVQQPLVVRHTVWFEGPLARLWSAILGSGFRQELPLTLARLARLAEAEAAQ